MRISIIDIGTQSLKHYIFEVEGNDKKLLHYKRYSEANLGESLTISKESIERNLGILKECLSLNASKKVTKLQVLGTEILRKATNAPDFRTAVKEISGHEVEIISQDLEAQYLYEGFISIIPDDFQFAAMNIGGGSTEVVVGNKKGLTDSKKLPFGVKFIKKTFSKDGNMDWNGIDEYLDKEIALDSTDSTNAVFVTGVLDFITAIGPTLGFAFEKNNIPNHPIKFTFDTYVSFLETLRRTPVEDLKKLYPKDPGYADNFAIGQSVYVGIVRKFKARIIIPSNNDLTDGVIHRLIC
jgi:exopolyphosphatase/guanosine-5'-triphosphate,3'-diphosphate pyrophosphatase